MIHFKYKFTDCAPLHESKYGRLHEDSYSQELRTPRFVPTRFEGHFVQRQLFHVNDDGLVGDGLARQTVHAGHFQSVPLSQVGKVAHEILLGHGHQDAPQVDPSVRRDPNCSHPQ